jgi:hypothetical protein
VSKPISDKSSPNRRAFLKAGGILTAATLGSAALPDVANAQASPISNPLPSNAATPASMPTRNLGKTGYKVGIFSLGGQAALEKANNEAIAVPIIEKALDLGVNYIDTSSIYGGPERWSEQYVGKVMKHRRNDAFLATKTKERTRDGSMRMIETSLKLLQTDHVDLWQLHDIGTMTDINEIFARGGAMEALLEARDQKIVPARRTDRSHPSPFVRHHPDGGECRRSTPLQLLRATAASGGGETDGHYRNESSGAGPHSFVVDTPAH